MADVFNLSNFALDQFRDAIAKHAILPPDTIIADGQIHRFSSDGKDGNDAGWYVLNEGAVATGSFGNFRTGVRVNSWTPLGLQTLHPDQKTTVSKHRAALRLQRQAGKARRHVDAVTKVTNILRIASPASDAHPYLVRKKVLSIWKLPKNAKDNSVLRQPHSTTMVGNGIAAVFFFSPSRLNFKFATDLQPFNDVSFINVS